MNENELYAEFDQKCLELATLMKRLFEEGCNKIFGITDAEVFIPPWYPEPEKE